MSTGPIVMTLDDVAAFLRCGCKRTALREVADLGVKPYRRGKYRRQDIENAVARASLRANQKKP
jgi:hypothetical protein